MRNIFNLILLLAFSLIACNSPEKPASQKNVPKTLKYPLAAYICFDRQEEGIRKKEFKLGDSCYAFSKYFDLDCDRLKRSRNFSQDLETRGKSGITYTTISFELDTTMRLKTFKAEWTYKGDSTWRARQEFYAVIRRNAMSCLWENGLNIFISNDTLKEVFFDNHVEEFVSDFGKTKWTVKFESRLNSDLARMAPLMETFVVGLYK